MKKKISIKNRIYSIKRNQELILKTKVKSRENSLESETLKNFENKLKKRVEEDISKYFHQAEEKEETNLKKISEYDKKKFKEIFLDVVYGEIKKRINNKFN